MKDGSVVIYEIVQIMAVISILVGCIASVALFWG
jgi:nitrogen fixation-related uncharacterized protein